MQLTMVQSMGSGFSAACLGPLATGPFDVIKVDTEACCCSLHSMSAILTLGLLSMLLRHQHSVWGYGLAALHALRQLQGHPAFVTPIYCCPQIPTSLLLSWKSDAGCADAADGARAGGRTSQVQRASRCFGQDPT